MRDIDDQTVAYIMAAQPCYEDLKQVASQLAGLLVLKAGGSKSVTPDHPMLLSAEQAHKSAADALRAARVSAHAREHHTRLLQACAQLDAALRLMRGNLMRGDGDPLTPLESAYAQLRSASKTLPGFEMISFERGCCAA